MSTEQFLLITAFWVLIVRFPIIKGWYAFIELFIWLKCLKFDLAVQIWESWSVMLGQW